MKEETTGINGDSAALAEENAKNVANVPPASAVAKEIGATQAGATDAAGDALGMPNLSGEPEWTGFNKEMGGGYIPGASSDGATNPITKAEEITNLLEVIDGDTLFDKNTKERFRLIGVDALELSQTGGADIRKFVQDLVGKGIRRIDRHGKDAYGRELARVILNDGTDLGRALIESGFARTHGYEEHPFSLAYSDAEYEAMTNKVGIWGPGNKASTNPAAWRRNHPSDYEREKWDYFRKNIIAKTNKFVSPERHKASIEDTEARNSARKSAGDADDSFGIAISTAVARIASVGFQYGSANDVPTHELNGVLHVMRSVFGYDAAAFRVEGFDDPYAAARTYVESAMGIVNASEKRRKAFEKQSIDERQKQVNDAFYGEDSGMRKWFSPGDLERFAETFTYKGLVDSALRNGADAKTVATAVMIALSEHQDEEFHRNRLAQMDEEQAKKCAWLAGAIRAQYDGNFFAKGMISMWNSIENIAENLKAVTTGDAFGLPTRERTYDLLASQLEDTAIDNTDDILGEVATVVGSSLPAMALLAIPYAGIYLGMANAFGEASRIPVAEGWEIYDPAKAEAFKATYGLLSPLIEKSVLGLAMKPIPAVARAAGVMSPRLAGMLSTKTLASWLAGSQMRSAGSKIIRGMLATGSRTVVSSFGEVIEEAAEQTILSGGGMFVDPRSADGRKIYNLERFGSDVVDAAWTAIKTAPWMVLPFAGAGIAREHYMLGRPETFFPHALAGKKMPNILEYNQMAVNAIAAYDAKTRAEKLGGLSEDEVLEFHISDAATRAEILENTTDKNKLKWLKELDKYLRYNEDLAKTKEEVAETTETFNPTKKATWEASRKATGEHWKAATADLEGEDADVDPEEETKAGSSAEAGNANAEKSSGEAAVPVSANTAAERAAEAASEGEKNRSGSNAGNQNIPGKEEKNQNVPAAGADNVNPTRSTKSVKSEEQEKQGKPKTKAGRKKRATPAGDASKGDVAKGAEKKAARKVGKSSSKKKAKRVEAEEVVPADAKAKEVEEDDDSDPLFGAGGSPEESTPTRLRIFVRDDPAILEAESNTRDGRIFGENENPYIFSLEGVIRPLSPEISAAFGDNSEAGVVLNPHMVEVFKGAIEEGENAGVAIMDIFERIYARKLEDAVEDPDYHKEFLADPFSWAEAVIDDLIGLARRDAAGDESAADVLERLYLGERAYLEEKAARGKPSENPALRPFVEFARKWLKSAFGESADIYFIEDAVEDPEHAEVVKSALDSAGAGKVNAFIVASNGNVYVSREANPVKVLHEVFGHATWQWMKANDAEGYAKLRELAENAPQEVKDAVARSYGVPDKSLPKEEYDRATDLYLDEVFAHLMEARYSGRVDSLFDTHEKRAWYLRVWDILVKALGRVAKAVFGEDASGSPEEFLNELSERFFGHGGLFLGEDAKGEGLRFSSFTPTPYFWNLYFESLAEKDSKSGGDPDAAPESEEVVDEQEVSGDVRAVDPDEQGVPSPLEQRENELNKADGEDGVSGATDAKGEGEAPKPSTGFQPLTPDEAGKPTYLSRDESQNPYGINDTFKELRGAIVRMLNLIGLEYRVLMSPTYWELFTKNAEGVEKAVEADSLARRKFEEILGKKRGKEREVAELLLEIAKKFSADPATSTVWVTESAAEEMQRIVEKIHEIVGGMKDGTERKAKLLEQADAAEELVGFAIRNTSTFIAIKNVVGAFVAFMRPSGRKIGDPDTELTASDYERFDVEDSRNLSGSARLFEMQGFDEVLDATIHMGHFLRNFEAMRELTKKIDVKYRTHPNKYVRGFVKEVLSTMNNAYNVANEEFKQQLIESETLSLLAQTDEEGKPLLTEEDARNSARANVEKRKITLRKWAEEKIKERKKRSTERARGMIEATKNAKRHEARAASILNMKSIKNIASIVSFLEYDDALRDAKAKREEALRNGVKPERAFVRPEPLSDELRDKVEAHVELLLDNRISLRLINDENKLPVAEQRKILRRRGRVNRLRELYGEFYRAYKAAREEGKILPWMSAEHAEYRKALRQYSEIADNMYRMPVGVASADGTEQTSVNPSGEYRTILRARTDRLERARLRLEEAGKAYDEHKKTRKYRDVLEIMRDIGRLVEEAGVKDDESDEVKGNARKLRMFNERLVELTEKYFGGGRVEEMFRSVRDMKGVVLEHLMNGEIDEAERVVKDVLEIARSASRRIPVMRIDAANKMSELSAFKFDRNRNKYVRSRKTESMREADDGNYDELPAGLKRNLERNQSLSEEERLSSEDVIWRWIKGEGYKNSGNREWIGLLSEMSREHFEELRRSTDALVAQAAEARMLSNVAMSVYDVVSEAVRTAKLSVAQQQESNSWAKPDARAAGREGARVIEQAMRDGGVSVDDSGSVPGDRRASGTPRPEIRYSKEADEGANEGARVGSEGAAERRARTMQERVIDFAVVFAMRMLNTGARTLSDKECTARARIFDPYMGGASLKMAVESAKVISRTMLEQPGVEKLDGDQLQQLALKIIQNLSGSDAAKIADALHDIQTDTWKSIAESYQKKVERLVSTGRSSEYSPLSWGELRKLGIIIPTKLDDVAESSKDGIHVEAYRGMNRKIFNHIFGAMKPKRSDYSTDEEYQEARKKYSEGVKNAPAQLLGRYRDTLTWIYGKYGTDAWLRRYFGESTSAAVRRLVGQMRDFADTTEEIYRYAERIEKILSQTQKTVTPETIIESIRSMIEPFVGKINPRRAMKKRKISPSAQAFLNAVYEGMILPDEAELRKKIGDSASKSDLELAIELAELRAKVFDKAFKDIEKKAEDAKNKFNGANEAHGSGVKQTAENAAKALIELSRQAGYRVVMPYLSLNGNSGVVGNPSARRANVIKMLDGIYFEVAKAIAEGANDVEEHVREETAAVAKFVHAAGKILSRGKSGQVDKNAAKKSFIKDLFRRVGALVTDGFSLKQRLEELGRFLDEKGRRELLQMFDEFINIPIAKAESERARHYLEARAALNEMIMRVYAPGEALNTGRVLAVLNELNTQLDELKEFSASGNVALTRAQLMAQVAMLSQDDVQAPILELERRLRENTLVEKDEDLTDEQRDSGAEVMTEEQRVMVRRLRALPKMIETLDRLSGGKDKAMIDEMIRYYEVIAPELDSVAVRITGAPVAIGSRRYFPVRRSSEYKTRGVDRTSRVISAVPDYLSPRENTTTDINEEADIFSVFCEQAENNAHFLAFGLLHYRMTTLFDNSDWSRLTNRLLGKDAATMLTGHVQDICSPKLLFVDNAGANSFWSFAKGAVAIAALGGNIRVALKQTTSPSAFAHDVGWRRFLVGLMKNPFSKEMQEARKELFESPEAKTRWGGMWVSIQSDLMKRPGKSARASKFFAYYMSLQRWGDFVPSWISAPGIYLANIRGLMARVNPETGKMFTEEEAKVRAREMVFDMIEKTQQTNRVSNLGHSQRRGQAMAQLWTQFMSSTILFFSSEARAVRDVVANPKNPESWKRFTGVVVSNHIVMPTLLKAMDMTARWVIGGDEPDEEDLKQWIAMIASGPLSGLMLLGSILTGDRKFGNTTAPTVSFMDRIMKHSGNAISNTFSGEFDEAAGDVLKLVKAVVPFARDADEAVGNYVIGGGQE